MSWSASEIEALAAKAARGAGAPPGQAAQFGRAAAHHLAQERPAQDLEDALKSLPLGAILEVPRILDQALVTAAPTGTARLDLEASSALVQSYVETLPFEAELCVGDVLQLRVDTRRPRAVAAPKRIVGQDALIAVLEALAARTYVPESETSRSQGAGAGISDND